MDVFNDELLRFWNTLNTTNVRYIMVGGLAIRFHGYNRNTDDLDLGWKTTYQIEKIYVLLFHNLVTEILLQSKLCSLSLAGQVFMQPE